MNKIKKIWTENKILFVLAIILLVCLIVIGIVTITYFYGSSDNPYGNRLDQTQNVPLDDEKLKNIEETLEKNESVKSAEVNKKGKIIYLIINYVDNTKMDKAKEIASGVLNLFSEEELAVYDLQFTIKAELTQGDTKNYTLMGARNSNGSSTIIWNNYNIKAEESTEE